MKRSRWSRLWTTAATLTSVVLVLWVGLLIAWGTFPWWLVFPWFCAVFQMGWVSGCLVERERWRSARVIFRVHEGGDAKDAVQEVRWRDG